MGKLTSLKKKLNKCSENYRYILKHNEKKMDVEVISEHKLSSIHNFNIKT